ncbi:hypothetical protein OMP38_14675 [Cohnella ginsengisoli]|uniref:Uncharacterized protein n=1 Tax=Cohnella ginsengisoli TaxID=425004 RepID=A0A9X4QN06_9BACL|nr:hypothetical protein [Cohnella ginsengisoli]MDG0791961.1 hypothetical protein [Cohnella ginsengisoli]
MSKSIYDFPKETQDIVCEILAKAAIRKAQAKAAEKAEKGA